MIKYFLGLYKSKRNSTHLTKHLKTHFGKYLRFEHLESRELLDVTTWTGNGDGLYWSDPGNWSNGVPSSFNDDVQILQNYTSTYYDLTTNPILNSITFGHGSSISTYPLNSHTIYINGGGYISANGAVASITMPIYLYGNVEMFITSYAPGLTISGNISGSGGITKTGAGPLTLSGTNSTYTGGTQLQQGTIKTTTSGALSSYTTVTFGSPDYNGTLDLAGTSQTVAGLAVASGATPANQIIGNSSTSNNATMTVNGTSSSFGGLIKDAISGGTKTTSLTLGGGSLTLNGTNSYTGGTTIQAGTLIINSDRALGAVPSTAQTNITFSGNAALQAGADDISLNYKRNINIANGRTATIDTPNNYSMTIAGVIGNATASGGITKTGSGTLTLGGESANTYTSMTTVNAGTLLLAKTGSVNAIDGGGLTIGDGTNTATVQYTGTSSNMMGSGMITIKNNGTLDLNGKTDNIGSLTFIGGGSVTTGTGKIGLGGNVTYIAASGGIAAEISGNIDLNNNRTFNIANDAILESEMNVSAVIANGSGSYGITKSGIGTLILTGTNTYSGGTTINEGTLQIGDGGTTGTLPAGTVTIAQNARLSFNHYDSITISNTIIGSGNVEQKGPGILTLTGNNTYSGGTFITNGTLFVNSDSNLGAASGALTFGTYGGCLKPGSGFTYTSRTINWGITCIIDNQYEFTLNYSQNITSYYFEKKGSGTLTINGSIAHDIAVLDGVVVIYGDVDSANYIDIENGTVILGYECYNPDLYIYINSTGNLVILEGIYPAVGYIDGSGTIDLYSTLFCTGYSENLNVYYGGSVYLIIYDPNGFRSLDDLMALNDDFFV